MRALVFLVAAALIGAGGESGRNLVGGGQPPASAIPQPTFHHIHINSTNPEDRKSVV